MGILYNRLLIVINDNSAGSTWYHIAMTMLLHMHELSELGINELAALCCVSKSTISKFIRTLGYTDYGEFRQGARVEQSKYALPFSFDQNMLHYIAQHSADGYFQTVLRDLEATYRQLDWDAVDRLVRDIASHPKVAAFGLMFSETAAIDLQTKLYHAQKFIITQMDDQKQMDYIRRAGEDTLMIIFSDSGQYIDRYFGHIGDYVDNGEFAATRARIVLITANEQMARDPRVAYCLLYRRTSALHTHSIMYQLLTDLITYRYWALPHPEEG